MYQTITVLKINIIDKNSSVAVAKIQFYFETTKKIIKKIEHFDNTLLIIHILIKS